MPSDERRPCLTSDSETPAHQPRGWRPPGRWAAKWLPQPATTTRSRLRRRRRAAAGTVGCGRRRASLAPRSGSPAWVRPHQRLLLAAQPRERLQATWEFSGVMVQTRERQQITCASTEVIPPPLIYCILSACSAIFDLNAYVDENRFLRPAFSTQEDTQELWVGLTSQATSCG